MHKIIQFDAEMTFTLGNLLIVVVYYCYFLCVRLHYPAKADFSGFYLLHIKNRRIELTSTDATI